MEVYIFILVFLQVMHSGTALNFMDASEVTWAHAVNSREVLDKELAGPVDFLEADVSLGVVRGSPFGQLEPVMAHPPDDSSDVSLAMWLDAIIASGVVKGLKLDFKSMDAVEPSLIILKERADKINGSLWLNADILFGPIHSSTVPLKESFLLLCHDYFPDAVLSLGWTTYWHPSFPPETWHYGWSHVRKMADVVRCMRYEHSNFTFTFPVRGIFASRSIDRLQWLLEVVPRSSLTLWTGSQDPLDLQDLIIVRRSFPKHKVFFDIPESFLEVFSKEKDRLEYVAPPPSIPKGQWIKLSRNPLGHQGPSCEAHTYISGSTIVFGTSVTTAVLLKRLFHVDEIRHLRAEGRIQFFDDDYQRPTTNHQLSIVIIDVSSHFKNSSTNLNRYLDMSEGDTDVWWSAINASILYTFHQNSSNFNRIFRLDTTMDRAFQAWTVPSQAVEDHVTLGDLTKSGQTEVPYTRTVVLPERPFMLGFVSSGPGHVVVEDLIVEDIESKYSRSSANIVGMSVVFLAATVLFCATVRHFVIH